MLDHGRGRRSHGFFTRLAHDRADRESQDRGVDEKADAAASQDHHHPDRLQDLLHDRGGVARQRDGREAGRVEEPPVDLRADEGGGRPREEGDDHGPHRDELEAVEEDEEAQEQQDRQEGEGDVQGHRARDSNR